MLSPPWEDKTIEDATEEILNGHIVTLKQHSPDILLSQLKKEFAVQKSIMRAIIKMLLRVIRRFKALRIQAACPKKEDSIATLKKSEELDDSSSSSSWWNISGDSILDSSLNVYIRN